MISRTALVFFFCFVQMDKLLSACVCVFGITQWIDFAPFQTLPRCSSCSSCEWNLCHEIARELICMRVWVCQILFTLPFTLSHFVLFLREIFASLFYFLLTLYNIVFTSCFFLVFSSISLRPIICSYETKLNFSSLLLFFCFHQVRRLLLLSCFPFLSTACTSDVTISCVESVSKCIGELACLLWCAKEVLACVGVWVRLLK